VIELNSRLGRQPVYVVAMIKHETNSFSPVQTPLASFGHGKGPVFGDAVVDAYQNTNTPLGAFIDVARREQARLITPVAGESWPSAPASRATFEALVQPLIAAVKAGCDAVFLDLHGAMQIEDCDDAEGEILQRVRAARPGIPVAVTFDFHTNLSAQTIENATVITGYKTYPHIDMYEVGYLAADILTRSLKGLCKPVLLWKWLPLMASIMRHAPEDGPSGDTIQLARKAESRGDVLAATWLGGFAHTDTPYTGVSIVVVADGRDSSTLRVGQQLLEEMTRITWERRQELVFVPKDLTESVRRAKQLGESGDVVDLGPVVLIDHCDNSGSGGSQDVMAVVKEIHRQQLDDVAVAPIRDPAAVAQMIAAGVGNRVTLSLGGKTDLPSIKRLGEPWVVEGIVERIADGEIVFGGPMYTGVKTSLGPTAVLNTGRMQIVITSLQHEPFDRVIFTHVGIDPKRKRYLMLKSRIHYRAGFKPIARAIVECMGHGVTSADLTSYHYKKLTRPVFPLDPL
jgi:microcystin degradation protein MlrC